MASKNLLIVFVAVNAILPLNVLAMDYLVGEESGWTPDFDYEGWAKDKVFRVGDKLVFKYTMGAHDVSTVDEKGFTNCEAGPVADALISGNDEIDLTTPGKKWFICSVGTHCAQGQKLAITVLGGSTGSGKHSAPAPTHHHSATAPTHSSAPLPSHPSSTHSPTHSPAASPTASPAASPTDSSASSPIDAGSADSSMDGGAPTPSGSAAPSPSGSSEPQTSDIDAPPPAKSSAHEIVTSEFQMLISSFVFVALTVIA